MPRVHIRKGAVTFLDVLGWKGIWAKEADAINTLHKFVNEIIEHSELVNNSVSSESPNYRGITTRVLSISDTIALFTFGEPYPSIKVQAEICSFIIPESIKRKIPIRGAIAYGEFSTMDNIMLGPAVDEAASWHESTDWFGVILSPSATFQLKGKFPDVLVKYDDIPFKKVQNGLDRCIRWDLENSDTLFEVFNEMGPFTVEIADKYLNTLLFLQHCNE